MKIYTVRYIDSVGHPRIETVYASSAYEVLKSIQAQDGEIVEQIEAWT